MEFLDSIPHGRDHYLEGTRLLMSNIYNKAMTDTDNYFLDKTPRYYLIIPELAELFPDAKFVFLFRNPLSVLASMHTTWKSVMGLLDSRFKKDLLRAPNLLISGKKMLDNRAFSISYESLVKNPEDELKSLCNWLSIPYQSTMMEYGGHDASRWVLGDQKTVYEYDRPITEKIDKWVEFIQSAQNWRYANCYLDYLGPDTVEQLGYSYDYLKDILISHKPSILTRTFTLPFFFSMSAHNILRKIYRRFVFKEARISQRSY